MTLPGCTTVVPVGGPVASQRDSRFPLRGSTGFRRLRLVTQRLPIAALLAAFSLSAHAEIFRCTAAGGAITYQEVPCPASAQARAMDIPVEFPEVNRAERDRLLQREAALDARMLKRAEIESAERIARDDRAGRDREAQALRDALPQREAAMANPGFLVIQPFRAPRVHVFRRPLLQRL